MSTIFINEFNTEFGVFRTAAIDLELVCISLPNESKNAFEKGIARVFGIVETCEGGTINELARTQIVEYLQGNRREFDIPLKIFGTTFQQQVLELVAQIPYGQTRTYGELAHDLNKPGAARAVGSANARNLLPLVIPCHRVLAVNGLGGYGGGLEMKKQLLQLEGAISNSLFTN